MALLLKESADTITSSQVTEVRPSLFSTRTWQFTIELPGKRNLHSLILVGLENRKAPSVILDFIVYGLAASSI